MHPSRQARIGDAAPPEPMAVDTDDGILLEDLRDETKEIELGAVRAVKETAKLVPTIDADVRRMLRALGEPVTLFGEDKADRRARLQQFIVSRQDPQAVLANLGIVAPGASENAENAENSENSETEPEDEEFYTPGPPEVAEARKEIAKFSLRRARDRIITQTTKANDTTTASAIKTRRGLNSELEKYTLCGSQLLFSRAAAVVRVSPDSSRIAVGSWTGHVAVVAADTLQTVHSVAAHTERIGGLDFHPEAYVAQQADSVHFATGGADGLVKLWAAEPAEPLATLTGHTGRVARVAFHPSGRWLGSASFDMTWRLWDTETATELVLQEGHAREVFAIAFQDDGALAGSAGLDGVGRVWDLRTGRSIMALEGHVREIYGLDFSPNGFQIATGSADGSVKIWDLRMRRCQFTIPAHTKIVSSLRFSRGPGDHAGNFLATSSYDGSVTIWSCDNWIKIKSLLGHTDRVMSVDIASTKPFIASSGWDKTVKLWADESTVL